MAFTINYVYQATDNFSPTIKKISDQLEILNKKLRETTLNLRRVTTGFRAARVAGTQFHRQLTQMNNALHASNVRMRAMDRSIQDINRRSSDAATQGLREMDRALDRIRSGPPLPAVGGGRAGGAQGGGAAGRRRQRAGEGLAVAGGALAIAVTAPTLLMGKAMLKAAADVESLEVSFTNTLKSASKAEKLMNELKKLSGETIFNLPELGQTARLLIATGIELKDIMPAIKDIGDVAAGTGKPIAGIGLAFGQVRAKGRLMGEEVLQFAERGIPLLPLLADKFDVTVLQMNKAISNGEVSFKRFREAWSDLVKEGGIFADQAQAQAKALGGAFKVFQSAVLLASAKAGMEVSKMFNLVDKLGTAGELVRALGDAFVRLADESPRLAKFTTLFAVMLGVLAPLAVVVGTLMAMGAIIPVLIGSAFVIAVAAWVAAMNDVVNNWDRMWGAMKNGAKAVARFLLMNNPVALVTRGLFWAAQTLVNSLPDWFKRLIGMKGPVDFSIKVPQALRAKVTHKGPDSGFDAGAVKARLALEKARRDTPLTGGRGEFDLGAGSTIQATAINKLVDSMDQWREEDRAIQLKITLDQEGRVEGASATGDVGVNLQ